MSSYVQQKGLQLVGYYHANERFDDTELGSSARKVADKLHSHNSASCAVLVRLAHVCGWKGAEHEFQKLALATCRSIVPNWQKA